MVWASIREPYCPRTNGPCMVGERIDPGDSTYANYDRAVTERTIEWLRNAGADDRPYVLYVGLVAPHFPPVVPEEFYNLNPPYQAITAHEIDPVGALLIFGLIGDGNFHPCFILDPNKPEEFAEATEINERMVRRALKVEGTCTGAHGVGYGKIGFLEEEHGAVAIGVMRELKRALDPHNLMNPGKVIRLGAN